MIRIGRLHVLTDTTIQDRFDAVELARRAIRGGADSIQYRAKDETTRRQIETARRIQALCRRAGIPMIVNDRIDVALAADADGVHLGRDDFPIARARQLLGPHRIIGGSAGNEEEAETASREGADYLGCGPIFRTATKADAGAASGPELIDRIRASASIPLIAIGGIEAANLPQLLAARPHGIAVVSAVCCAEDPEAATRRLREILDASSPQGGAGDPP